MLVLLYHTQWGDSDQGTRQDVLLAAPPRLAFVRRLESARMHKRPTIPVSLSS